VRFDATGEVACYTYIKGSIGFVGEDIDHRLLHGASNAFGSAWVD
jgi:hypothetical protein